jgi:quinoprotein relay system zinc metallohydrolase 2
MQLLSNLAQGTMRYHQAVNLTHTADSKSAIHMNALPVEKPESRHIDRVAEHCNHLREIAAAFFLALTVCIIALQAGESKAEDRIVVPITEIAPGVFVHQGKQETFTPDNRGDVSNAGFVVGTDAVAVIDTGGSRQVGEGLLQAIRQHTSLPVRYVINTHMHPDHVFGNAAFTGETPRFTGHHKLPRALATRREQYLTVNKTLLGAAFDGIEVILPTEGIEGKKTIDLGGRKLILEAHPTAHTDNDLTVYDVQTGTMFMGDLLFSGHIPVVDGSIRGWLALMKELSARKLKRVVPGHGPASMPWPDAMAAQQRYLETISSEIRQFIADGKTLADAAKTVGLTEKDAWLLFDEFNARNVSASFAELEWE